MPILQKKELFLVEGKSAHNALSLAIDNKTQSVYAIQGKLANVEKLSHNALAENLECQQLLARLGGSFTQDYQVENLSCSHVLILMDPDIDGLHSSALVLSFLARYCKPLLAARLLSIVKPPMFKLSAVECKPTYAWTEEELQLLLSRSGNKDIEITRYKGVAQYSIDECHHHLLHAASRRAYLLS